MKDEINLNVNVVPSSEIAARVIDGEAVIVTIPDSKIYILNPVATRIWELIEKNLDVKEIIKKITMEFNVVWETALKDTLYFINEMKKKNIIRVEKRPKRRRG